jgi:hypothetical protein
VTLSLSGWPSGSLRLRPQMHCDRRAARSVVAPLMLLMLPSSPTLPLPSLTLSPTPRPPLCHAATAAAAPRRMSLLLSLAPLRTPLAVVVAVAVAVVVAVGKREGKGRRGHEFGLMWARLRHPEGRLRRQREGGCVPLGV